MRFSTHIVCAVTSLALFVHGQPLSRRDLQSRQVRSSVDLSIIDADTEIEVGNA